MGLPDDDVISTKSFAVKQRKFEKVNERLSLKLRASEEMRLQLKLEKNDLKWVYILYHLSVCSYAFFSYFRRQLQSARTAMDGENDDTVDSESAQIRSEYDIKYCEQCLDQYNFKEATRPCSTCRKRAELNWCGRCHNQLIKEKV